MSLFISVVAQVAATPVPTPSPEVVTIIKEVTPAWVDQVVVVLQQLATLGLFVIPALLASKIQTVVGYTKDGFKKLGSSANVLIAFGYSVVLGLLGLVSAGQLNLLSVEWTNPAAVGAAILTVFGAASARYAKLQASKSEPQTEPIPDPSVQY